MSAKPKEEREKETMRKKIYVEVKTKRMASRELHKKQFKKREKEILIANENV